MASDLDMTSAKAESLIDCSQCTTFFSHMLHESLQGQHKREQYYDTNNLRDRWLKIIKLRFPHKTEAEHNAMLPQSVYGEIINETHELCNILIKLSEVTLEHSLHFEYMYIDDFNAFAIRAPNGHSAIIINSRLIESINMLNSVIVDYLIKSDFSKAGSLIKYDVLIFCQTLVNLTLGYATHPDYIKIWEENYCNDPMKYFLTETLGTTQLAFIIAHELAHHALGHTTSTYNRSLGSANECDYPCYSRSQEQELEADRMASQIFIEYFNRYSQPSMYSSKFAIDKDVFIGPILLMVYLECLENGSKGYLANRSYKNDSHPPALLRRKQIHSILSQNFSDSHRELLNFVNHFFFECIPYYAKKGGSKAPSGYSVIDEEIGA